MKKRLTNYLLGSMAIVAVMFTTSCGEEESVPMPSASFTTEVDGKTITITNNSEDADSYSWDFGDGGSSEEEAPVYTYAANGSYIVTLTATNSAGSDDSEGAVEIINITIDGDFSDWDDVEYAVQYSFDSEDGGSTKGLKIENLSNQKLYLYVEGTSDLSSLSQIFLNTDNDTTTTAEITWRYYQGGEDYMIEGAYLTSDVEGEQFYDLYEVCKPSLGCTPTWEGWNWAAASATDFVEASQLMTITGGNAYEIAIDLTAFPTTISSESIGIAVMDLLEWAEKGAIPIYYNENTNPTGSMYLYDFK